MESGGRKEPTEVTSYLCRVAVRVRNKVMSTKSSPGHSLAPATEKHVTLDSVDFTTNIGQGEKNETKVGDVTN